MSGAILNNRFLTRLLTSGKEDIERVSMLKEYIVTMLILSISVTFNASDLFDRYSFNYENLRNHASNVGQYILVHFTR